MKAAAKRKIGHTAKKESKHAVRTKKAKNPTFHHALLKTARMQEMIDWYAAVVGIARRYIIGRFDLGSRRG